MLASCAALPQGARLAQAGDRSVDVRAAYGVPIVAKSVFWDGNGDVDDVSLKARHLWHTSDHFAVGAGLALNTYLPTGADVFGLEAEAVSRSYLFRSERFGVFSELTGGYMQSTGRVPAGGTEWNFTFSFGAGVEIPVERDTGLQMGINYHHVSNALGRMNDRNPSQNEAQFWFGFEYRL
ncbi:MAG: acyloxyacyl hydrolase [Planctomycetes bacterium]|nr:acyloxyacyl hydrolase [Planctomycetota bacterium]